MIKHYFIILLISLTFTSPLHCMERFRRVVGSLAAPSLGTDVGQNFGVSSSRIWADALGRGATLQHALEAETRTSFRELGTQLIAAASLVAQLENIQVKHTVTRKTQKTISSALKQTGFVVGGAGLMIGALSVATKLASRLIENNTGTPPYINIALGTCSLAGFLSGALLVRYSDKLS